MMKTTWKKIISFVLVAALVVSTAYFGSTKANADDRATAVASGTMVKGEDGTAKDAFQYTVTRTGSQTGGEPDEVNLLIVMDSSGSMRYRIPGTDLSRQKLAIQEINAFLDKLDENVNLVNVVYYNREASQASYSDNDEKYYVATPEGGTNIDAGIELAQSLLKDPADPSKNLKNPIIVVLSDGEPTYATVGDGGQLIGNGSTSPADVKKETSDQIDRAVAQGITIYAIKYGDEASIFTDKDNVKNYSAGFTSEELKAEFDKIVTEIHKYFIKNSRIEAKLGKFVKYNPSSDDAALGVNYNDETKMLVWTIPNTEKTEDTKNSPEFNFEIFDPTNPDQTNKTEIAKALINYYKANPELAKSEGLTVVDGDDGTVKIIVDVTVPNATLLYYRINDEAEKSLIVETFGTLTKTYFEGTKPTTTWTVNYTVGGEQKDSESVVLPCDQDFPMDTHTYKTPATFTTPIEGQFDRGTITVSGTIVTVPYTEKSKYTVSFFVDDAETAATTRTAYVGSAITDIPAVVGYQSDNSTISGWNNADGTPADFSKTDADYSVYAVNTPNDDPEVEPQKYTLTINYICYKGRQEEQVTVSTSVEKQLAYNANYSVDSPTDINGYVLADDVQKTISGVMPDHDETIDVIYRAVHTVTLKVDGKEKAIIPVVEGESYTAPDVNNYKTADHEDEYASYKYAIEGWYGAEPVDLEGVYEDIILTAENKEEKEVKRYALTIKYLSDDGKIDESITAGLFEYNEFYSFAVSAKEGYEASRATVEGNMPAKAYTEVVKYSKKAPTVEGDDTYTEPDQDDPEVVPPTPEKEEEVTPTTVPFEFPPLAGTTPEPTPEPTAEPTPEPTPEPTAEPTAEPTQEPEEIPVDQTETPQGDVDLGGEPGTPQGDVDLGGEPETPQGTPDEDVDLDVVLTPQGDLPKTGVASSAVFFGIGAACIVLGGAMVAKFRRREEEM